MKGATQYGEVTEGATGEDARRGGRLVAGSTEARYRKLTVGLLAAWFAVALSASAMNVFRTDPTLPPVALGIAVLTPIIVFLLWYARSPEFRQFVLSLNPQVLTFVQSWRIAGFTFLVLYSTGNLPGIFALPAGWGDVAIGVTAPFVAISLARFRYRKSFVVWQALGILDLVLAVSLGTTARFIQAQGPSTQLMTVLPLSMIPTFAVPILAVLHIICIAQARRWREGAAPENAEPRSLAI